METEVAQGAQHGERSGQVSDAVAPDSESPRASIDAIDSLLDEVEGALSRLDDGTYGLCGSCGTPIDDALLARSPTTQFCSACTAGNAV